MILPEDRLARPSVIISGQDLGLRNYDQRQWAAVDDRQMLESSATSPGAALSVSTTKEGAAMRALVVYESMYGNTHRIALAIAGAFARRTQFRLSRWAAHGMSMWVATT